MRIFNADETVEVYSLGICAVSVCADNKLTSDEVVAVVNRISPTGISSDWQLSEATFFHGGMHRNGCPCEENPSNRRHWLLEC